MSKPRILVQFDGDAHASVFDAITAIDADVDHLLQYSRVEPTEVRELVHGAMFTRGAKDLHRTAIFIGGSDVEAGEALLEQVTNCFFGPMRVSVMLDANGANTTAAAAVLAAARHTELRSCESLVMAATGPVGQRAARLLAGQGARVRIASRSMRRAEQVCRAIERTVPSAELQPVQAAAARETASALDGVHVVIAAGAAGIELASAELLADCDSLKAAIDLNAVPPAGLAIVEAGDRGVERNGTVCYGAMGVGGDKMKIHKAAIRSLFEANDQVLDAEEIFAIGRELGI